MSGERDLRVHPDMPGRLKRRGLAFVADDAVVVGDVTLGADANVWFGVTIRGDDAPIVVGAATNLQDQVVVHADPGAPQRIGAHVTVGHRATLHGVEIGDRCLIGIGAILLGGSRIGELSIIGAGALVPEGMVVPPRSVVLGLPGRVRRQITPEEEADLRARPLHYVRRAMTYLAD
jgi:carbonic anhydrase/acetyltransferase-like protein (isoleucine patch superfamily)